jgi:hypothetical protein
MKFKTKRLNPAFSSLHGPSCSSWWKTLVSRKKNINQEGQEEQEV